MPEHAHSAVRFKNPRAQRKFLRRSCSITGIGMYLPSHVLTNADLGKRLDEDEQWIFRRTGIRERRIAAENEFTSDLAANAALRALKSADLSAENVGMIIVATGTPDMLFPATACLVQAKIGAKGAAAFDLKAAGAGFLYALEVGQQFVASHTSEAVLVVGAEKLSTVVDWKDRDTCVLFGDGAGAAILQHRAGSSGLLISCLGSHGYKAPLFSLPGGGSQFPASHDSVGRGLHFLRMRGKATFKEAVRAMCGVAAEALQHCGLTLQQIKCIIPHQSNRRIIDAFAERLGASEHQVFVNLERYGNTSAASIPIALDEASGTGRIQRGDLVLLVGFGAGLTWAATIIEW